MSIAIRDARKRFETWFGFAPTLAVRAPGRVNIIGEHTDYNEGFVLPMAIEQETVILARPREDQTLHAYAANLERSCSVPLNHFARNPDEPWMDYVIGVAYELSRLGRPLKGADLLIVGDVPIGAGLSSSASIEMATLALFEAMGGYHLGGPEGAMLGKRVENDFLGLSSGIMDQFIIRMGKAGHALFLDCRSHEYSLIPVAFAQAKFVVANTGVTRGLTKSKYNERVGECAEAVRTMNLALKRSATHLRDFSMKDLDACRETLSDVVFRRARHIITENARTQAACEAMRPRVPGGSGDAAALGNFMNESDASLRRDYEVTCPELDAMTSIARSIPGCFGSRMTGAGFGGCTVSLVDEPGTDEFAARLAAGYRNRTGLEAAVLISAPADGAGAVKTQES